MTPLVAVLIRQHLDAMNSLVAQAVTQIEAEWALLGGDFNDEAMERWVRRVTPLALGSQRAAGATTDAFLAMLIAEMTGERARPLGLDRKMFTDAALRDLPTRDVYRRPILRARYSISKGMTAEQARQAGLDRARTLIETDVRLAQRKVSSEVFSRVPGITGYRRTLTNASCPRCRVASEKVYRTGDLMPIHSKCDCGVVPILGNIDPGSEHNASVTVPEERAPVESNDELGPVFQN